MREEWTMTVAEWEKTVPQKIRGDTVWRVEAYRLALLSADMGWTDVTVLAKDRRTLGLSDQLYRSLGSISANIEEGFSKGTGKDRARFYEYTLGSARESRGWYYKGRHVLSEAVVQHRMQVLTHVIKLLLTMIPDQRGPLLHESLTGYDLPDISSLLDHIPLS